MAPHAQPRRTGKQGQKDSQAFSLDQEDILLEGTFSSRRKTMTTITCFPVGTKNRPTVILTALFVGALALIITILPASAQSMAQEILNAHNQARAEVRARPLTWSNQLASDAQAWANHLASKNAFEHSHTSGQGENLWMGTERCCSFTQMVGTFINEKKFYNGGVVTGSNFHAFGHYTQVVWRDTTQVGCAGATGSDRKYRLVCRYSPAGNVIGQKAF
jgi:uncharacterized protein YkwD